MGNNKKGTVYSKEDKICVYCGSSFKGTFAAMTCSNSCRCKMNRIIDLGHTPKFYLQALNNGQKVPVLLADKKDKPAAPKVQNLTQPIQDTRTVKKLGMEPPGMIEVRGETYLERMRRIKGIK